MIKVIKGMHPDEVMREVRENGKRWAAKTKSTGEWILDDGGLAAIAKAISLGYEIAIVDDTPPPINWKEFDWGFFNQYYGVPVAYSNGNKSYCVEEPSQSDIGYFGYVLRKSPIYFWLGGKCPVPDNVEVDVFYRKDGNRITKRAGNIDWTHWACVAQTESFRDPNKDIIGFQLTGKVFPQ